MGVVHGVGAGQDHVRGQGQHQAAGAGIAGQAADHQLAGGEQFQADVVDGLDIGPGLQARYFGGLDHVEVHAVAEGAAAATHQQHLGVPGLGPAQGADQALALFGAHGAVVELEGQFADLARFAVADRLVGLGAERAVGHRPVQHRDIGQALAEHVAGGALEGFFARLGLLAQGADPQAVIATGHQYCVVVHRQQLPGHAGARIQVGVVHVVLAAGEAGQDAGLTVGGIDAALDELGAVVPAEGAVGLLHVRLQAPEDRGFVVVQGLGV